jgi:hypothetical protein
MIKGVEALGRWRTDEAERVKTGSHLILLLISLPQTTFFELWE